MSFYYTKGGRGAKRLASRKVTSREIVYDIMSDLLKHCVGEFSLARIEGATKFYKSLKSKISDEYHNGDEDLIEINALIKELCDRLVIKPYKGNELDGAKEYAFRLSLRLDNYFINREES